MASFEIKDCPTKLTITETEKGGKKVQAGMLTLDIRNATDRRRTGRIRVEPGSGAKPEWFSIEGAPSTNAREIEQDFAAKGQQSVRVNLAVPAGEPAKSLLFNALVTAEDDPDNDFVKGPNVAFDIAPWKEPPKPNGKPFPWWIVAVAVVLVIVAGGVITYLIWPNGIDVVGLPLDQAMTKLEQAGTKAADITAVADTQPGDHDPKTVIRMEKNGDKVKLVYDPGVHVPPAGNRTFDQVAADFVTAGFVLAPNGLHREAHAGSPEGTVFNTKPPGDTFAKQGSPFELWVAESLPGGCPPSRPWCRGGVVVDHGALIKNLQETRMLSPNFKFTPK
jgi:hypothetical protein